MFFFDFFFFQDSITHKSTASNNELKFTWTAPNKSGSVKFRATFAKEYQTFWVGVESPVVTIA